jgi:uncharacterized protein YdcH (DUF465 family)
MASIARAPRDIVLETDAEYQRLSEQHRKYDGELQRISRAPYLSSEDLLEEIKLKKMKLLCKDEMERIAARIHRVRAQHTQ